jgi:hypothetical protein
VQTERGKAFEEHEPNLSEAEISQAMDSDRVILSLKGTPVLHPTGAIQFLAVKFALADGSFETVLFDRMDAAALKSLVDAADRMNWDGNLLRPGPARN